MTMEIIALYQIFFPSLGKWDQRLWSVKLPSQFHRKKCAFESYPELELKLLGV